MTPPLAVKEGWPTDTMVEAGARSICEGQYGHFNVDDGLRLCAREAFAAMLAAAPAYPNTGGPTREQIKRDCLSRIPNGVITFGWEDVVADAVLKYLTEKGEKNG